MLVNLPTILSYAEEHRCAIGSFNCPNLESLLAILDAAEEVDKPVILMFAEVHEPLLSIKDIGPIMLDYARRAKVPVCVHLDHGEDLDYVKLALSLGFTSVMYDGSTLPYEENLKNTKEVVSLAHEKGAGVEAELGTMGRRESGAKEDIDLKDETKIYTDPVLAAEFVKATGIDALACSFGTTHGIYLKQPKLDYSVISRVRELTHGIPVVMHGGSGVSEEGYRKSIEAGVRKVNYFTYMDKCGGETARRIVKKTPEDMPVFLSDITAAARLDMKENVKSAILKFALENH